jgi:hypothetical protein
MNQKTLMVVLVTAVVTLVLAPKLRSLPGVSKLPTV